MNILNIIQGRRSIRVFKIEPIDIEVLKNLIIQAAIWAPSAGNSQILRYIVINDDILLHKIEIVSPGLSGTPAALVIVCQDSIESQRKGGKQGPKFLAIADASMAAQNIALYAHSIGLGTCMIASFHIEAVQKILKLPQNIIPIFLISVGYPEYFPEKAPPRNKDVVWFNEYK